jgi:hypothetical protein
VNEAAHGRIGRSARGEPRSGFFGLQPPIPSAVLPASRRLGSFTPTSGHPKGKAGLPRIKELAAKHGLDPEKLLAGSAAPMIEATAVPNRRPA